MYEFFEIGNLENKVLEVKNEGRKVINIPYYFNQFHKSNVYIKIDEIEPLYDIGTKSLNEMSSYFNKPIQVMVFSNQKEEIARLKKLGFERKRVCTEVEVSKNDFYDYDKSADFNLIIAHKGSKEFELCADIMLKRYVDTHRDINAWTGDEKDFFSILPEKVIYEKNGDKIENLAFIEDEEIAYVCGKDAESFRRFSRELLWHLFEKYENIFFEADDNDEFAMELKKLSGKDYDVTWDTYIYKK